MAAGISKFDQFAGINQSLDSKADWSQNTRVTVDHRSQVGVGHRVMFYGLL
jgi:hypothetical protein